MPEAKLLAALVEAAYVEHVAAADHGAFTNVDIVALAGKQVVAFEVKRRIRPEAEQLDPLTLTDTQAGTLDVLNRAGVDVHLLVRMVPPNAVCLPADALSVGHWQVARPPPVAFGTVPDVTWIGRVSAPTLEASRHARTVDLSLPPAPLDIDPAPVPKSYPAPVVAPTQSNQPAPPSSVPSPRLTSAAARLLESSGPTSPAGSSALRPAHSTALTLKGPRRLVSFSFEYAFLRVWSPAPVKLGGRVYPNPAVAFLAARTLDEITREALSEAADPGTALSLARQAPVRPDWPVLQGEVADAVLRSAYRGERGAALVATLPMLLADPEKWGEPLNGLQGTPGLERLSVLRGTLALRQVRETPGTCMHCRWAQSAPWAGFLRCTHPKGAAGTLTCVGRAACAGPANTVLVAVTTPGGEHFTSEQPTHRP